MERREKNSRKVLTLEERIKVIERSEKGETSKAIALSLDVGKNQVQNIIRDKQSILDRWKSGEGGERKIVKRHKTLFSDINDKVWDWFIDCRRRRIPVTGPLIQECARDIALRSGNTDFTASNGWLQKWLNRNNVKSAVLSGEKGDVNEDVVQDWIKRVPTHIFLTFITYKIIFFMIQ